MRIVLLSAASSVHTVRWANGLNAAGVDVHVISQHPLVEKFDAGVKLHIFPFHGAAGYFLMVFRTRKIIKKISPDVINAHFASGYGTTARLVGAHPWLLSLWGSDVYDFPMKSIIHRYLLKKNLMAADSVASTSHCMADEACNIAPSIKEVHVTPFGVDVEIFKENSSPLLVGRREQKDIVIGTVKAMKDIYGIDILITAFALVLKKLNSCSQRPPNDLELRLVGGGDKIQEYKRLADELGVAEKVIFTGQVPYLEVPREIERIDIYVALSRRESFGVAVIEAGAAGKPVVVSDTGGLSEVTLNGKTGIVVPREDAEAAADAILSLILNPSMRVQYGMAGQCHVTESYSWSASVSKMIRIYKLVVDQFNRV